MLGAFYSRGLASAFTISPVESSNSRGLSGLLEFVAISHLLSDDVQLLSFAGVFNARK